jgi:hypothetical protein
MKVLDCGVFYEWEYDEDFVSMLCSELESLEISYERFGPGDFEVVHGKLRRKTLSFRTVIDRASDVDDDCESIVTLLRGKGIFVLNDPEKVRHASDKASMHLEFITAGIYVPYTIIISPYNKQQEVALRIDQLAYLGRPFIIKPANTTGGGIGVVRGAESLREVIDTRQHNKDDKYLLQRKVEPMVLSSNGGERRRAWFRPFYVFGKVFICWWDDLTHIYFEAMRKETDGHRLREIERIVRKIHEVSGLEFFSTEIAITPEGEFIVIDYVNEMCDMRLKSKHFDGVPDNVVNAIVKQIAIGISEQSQIRKDAEP